MSEPRTPREFADARMATLVACRCGHEQVMDPLTVAFIYGDAFDLISNWRELAAILRCEACGSPMPIIRFVADRSSDAAEVAEPRRLVVGGRR